jgi:hypothetical protein
MWQTNNLSATGSRKIKTNDPMPPNVIQEEFESLDYFMPLQKGYNILEHTDSLINWSDLLPENWSTQK